MNPTKIGDELGSSTEGVPVPASLVAPIMYKFWF
jgi:hypothetical protein